MSNDVEPEMRVLLKLEHRHVAIPRYSLLSLADLRGLSIQGVLLLNVCVFFEANFSICGWVSSYKLGIMYRRNCKRFAATTVVPDDKLPSVLCNLYFAGILDMQTDAHGNAMWRISKSLDDIFRQLLRHCKDRCKLMEQAIELAGDHTAKSLFLQVLVLHFLIEHAAGVPEVLKECGELKV